MAAGQGVFSGAVDVAALDAIELRLMVREAERGANHAGVLRELLELHALYAGGGMGVSTVSHAALALGCSEHRAGRLLAEAQGLAELPGGLEAVECGLLSVEQAGVLVGQLAPVELPVRLAVWRRLQARLVESGVLPPARLAELLRRWIIAADADAAVRRRSAARDGRRVDYRRREDGLWDLFALGLTGPDAQAVLSRIARRAQPVGLDDARTADQRRCDAVVDLLLGRESLPMPGQDEPPVHGHGCTRAGGRAVCGCLPGAPAPCGAEVLVHVRWEAALGVSDEPAELVGHGPLEPDLLGDVLLAGPRLRTVWTDEHGVPVAVDDRTVPVPRADPQALRRALLDLAERPPQQDAQPRHPNDHRIRPPDGAPPDAAVTAGSSGAHPADDPGPYRPPRRVRRLLQTRAPRCEWPGCGARAVRCDAEHDRAWPDGPTCACNLGPCCRRHHRVKQCGWVKTRRADGSVLWTGPTGRAWLSPAQHSRPQPATRPLRPVPTPDEWDTLSPAEVEDELESLGLLPDDDRPHAQPADDHEPPDTDRLGAHLQTGDTRWTLDLDNPWLWIDQP